MKIKERNPHLARGKEIETQRLRLRPWRREDLDDFYAYARDEEVGPRAGWEAHTSKDMTKRILDYFIEGQCVFALEEKKSGRVLGSLGVDEPVSPLKELFEGYNGREIGYVLHRDFWNQGLMSEAVAGLLEVFFRDYDLDYFVCGHFEGNEGSRRVIEKTGFTFIGKINYVTPSKKQYVTLIYYQWNPAKTDPFRDRIGELL